MRDYWDPNPRPRRGSRRTGTNPRALGTNPRALGTNPSVGTPADAAREANYVLRAYDVLRGLGLWLCHECDDSGRLEGGTPCTCRRLDPRLGRRLVLTVGRMRDRVMAERHAIEVLGEAGHYT